jgi:fused signal recognition particle receptor
MLAAADTYRAAAVEQLKVWGERNDVPVVAQSTGSDAASVIFDAYDSAKAKGIDILIADTAGRLHTQKNLMQELEKIDRVIKKQDPQAPHETMLVVDGTAGQNALNQAIDFNKLLNITGITITKLDGTAKGGVLFSISNELKLPIRFIGVGEGIDDLRVFNAKKFVDAIFN